MKPTLDLWAAPRGLALSAATSASWIGRLAVAVALAWVAAASGCRWAQKTVGEGEPCGDDAFDGEIVCDTGLVCLVKTQDPEWAASTSGVCVRACADAASCACGGSTTTGAAACAATEGPTQ